MRLFVDGVAEKMQKHHQRPSGIQRMYQEGAKCIAALPTQCDVTLSLSK
jgi:hypothetical protein